MKLSARSRHATQLPGLHAPARVDRRPSSLLGRLRPGDIAVIDHLDMDRATAQALVDARVGAVVNAGPMISGRYPNLGPQTLVDAGILVVDLAGGDVLRGLRDGATVRLDGPDLCRGEEVIATGRVLDHDLVSEQMRQAREGLTAQLESFTHNTTEFLRREQDVLLHGHGLPATATELDGRPAVVVVRSHDWAAELRGLRPFLREQRPALVAVDRGADALAEAGHHPDVVVLSGSEEDLPAARVLRRARDVVLLVEPGAPRAAGEHLERIGVRAVRFETGATAEDAALLLADDAGASLIVGVGMHATLDEFLDRRRSGLASTFLARLKVGPKLVDAAAVPSLYDGAVRPRHLVAVLLAGALALATAVGLTPVGQEWYSDLAPTLLDLLDDAQGLLP